MESYAYSVHYLTFFLRMDFDPSVSPCTQMLKKNRSLSQNYFSLEAASLIYFVLNSLLNFTCLWY